MERPMNTAGPVRGVQAAIERCIRNTDHSHTPVSRVKIEKAKDGRVTVNVYSSRPEFLRMEIDELTDAVRKLDPDKDIKLNIIGEARAVAKFVRTSPRKARFVIETIKGKRVSEAMAILKFTGNHASEPLLKVLQSAAANAKDGWGVGPEELKVANLIAAGGPPLKRIRARAQGRAFRILKRTSHLTAVVLDAPPASTRRRSAAKPVARQIPPPPKATVSPVLKPASPASEVAEKPNTSVAVEPEEPMLEAAAVETALPNGEHETVDSSTETTEPKAPELEAAKAGEDAEAPTDASKE